MIYGYRSRSFKSSLTACGLIGMITDRDITLRTIGFGIDPRYILVGDCMSQNIYAGHKDDSIGSCMKQMARYQIRRLPILNDENHVVGIISVGDLAWLASAHPGMGTQRAVADLVCAVSAPGPASSH